MKKALLLASLLISSLAMPAQDAVLLRFRVKQGDVFRYRYEVDDTAMAMSLRVASAKGRNYVLHTRLTGMSVGGSPVSEEMIRELKRILVITKTDPLARDLGGEVRGGPPGTREQLTSGHSIPYPEKPVKVGDSWRGRVKMLGATVLAEFRVVAFENFMNRRAVRVHSSFSGLPDGLQYDQIATILDLETGLPLSATMTGSTSTSEAIRSFRIRLTRI